VNIQACQAGLIRTIAAALVALALPGLASAQAPDPAPAVAAGGTLSMARLVPGAADGAQALRERMAHNADKARQYEALKARVQPYVERHRGDPAWIVSRLQMYWQSRATQVYVKNDLYDHAEGKAPVPTVRFTGARDTATPYMTPKLEDVKPYMGENDRLYLQNKSAPGQPWEWAEQAKTGRIIETINLRIVELARDAAFVYWYSGDEAYAKFAYDIFDTYMTGLYYRLPTIDLNHGHAGTIVALQSFEVIHEDTALPLTEVADFMRGYLAARAGANSALYDGAFKKWADVIISNGVPWNNWNLIKARWALQIAAVLGDDNSYADRRGRQYYVKAAVEGQGLRQWSLQRLLDFGYDDKSAMWNESPGYAMNVLGDYFNILDMLDRLFGIDLMPQMGVLPRAALAAPQYLLPNGRAVGFGDTRYDLLRSAPFEDLLAYAERKGLSEQARQYAALLAAVRATGGAGRPREGKGDRLYALLAPDAAPKGGADLPVAIEQFQTPTYYAPGPSWLVQRNGYTLADAREQALVISQAGSNGNHAHANGIAMELYAQGLSLAPESGRGSGYFQQDYRDYYAQFPAHNTVVVDGKSNYAPMQSNHPITVLALYPQSGQPAAAAFPLATFSDVAFREPETDADQQRVLGTVRLDDKSAYFIDIFRSRRRDGKDRYHDYIYHNLGQSMQFQTPGGEALAVAAAGKLAFADKDLTGYDYWWDRKSLTSVKPLKARFELKLPQTTLAMTAWLQGSPRREYFSLQSPPSTAWVPGLLPVGIDTLPLPTLVIRQTGEAWSHPFTAVFEAVKDQATASVLNVQEIIPQAGALGLCVTTVGGRRQTILSNDAESGRYASAGLGLTGRYGVVAELAGGPAGERASGSAGGLDFLFLGSGREISGKGYAIRAAGPDASAALWQAGGHWYYSGSQAAILRVPAAGWSGVLTVQLGDKAARIAGRLITAGGARVREFAMPAMAAAQIR
jgi:hypothetical protein